MYKKGVRRGKGSASSCWEQAHGSLSTNIQADEAPHGGICTQVHAVTLTALRRTTLSDPQWDIRGATAVVCASGRTVVRQWRKQTRRESAIQDNW